jgi:hypothetical protein
MTRLGSIPTVCAEIMEFTKEEIARFHKKYVKHDSGCWNWTAGRFEVGYGMFSGFRGVGGTRKRTMGAHRVSWMIHSQRPIPAGMCICHHCDNRLCVNPVHLYLGTYQDNNRDTIRRNRGNRNLGSACSWSKVTEEQVLEILRSDYGRGDNGALAKKFGISQSQVSHIRSGKRWPHMRRFLPNG